MERRVLDQKVESLRRCLSRITEKLPKNSTVLQNDFDIQDIISVNLERAVQQCIDIAAHLLADSDKATGQSAASLFLDLALQGYIPDSLAKKLSLAVGFRNLLVHRYATIDWAKTYQTLQQEISDREHGTFFDFIRSIDARV